MKNIASELQTNFDLVIFGGDGDLSYRKIFPALYYRLLEEQIGADDRILALARKPTTTEGFRTILKSELNKYIENIDEKVVKKLLSIVFYAIVDITSVKDTDGIKKFFENSNDRVRVFYLATPASIFGQISSYLNNLNLISKKSRVVLEKPLGTDLESSESINAKVAEYFTEKQIYRIDHYLGKETVQNLMVLRFANNIFERSWNAQEIDNIQITVSESLGVGTRGDFYDKYGALKDMVQNHLLQLLCLIAMEPPITLDADQVRDEKLKVLKALRPFTKESIKTDTVRGQYTRGKSSEGQLASYLEDINKYDSSTETFVALKTYIDNWRWGGVPIYVRTGKRMPHRFSEIVINFKHVPHNIFPEKKDIDNNKLTIRLQPEERIELQQMVKIPGPGGYRYKPFSLELDYADHFNDRFPDAYERLLMDVVRGNQTLFMRRDEVKASWEWIESILKNWKSQNIPNILYEAGSAGPGDRIMNDNTEWVKSRHVQKVQEKKKRNEK
jgi:glucose-6-phosphate 1-dehydrogenase